MKFYIQNVETGLVLDIKGANHDSHGEIIMWPYKGSANQLWKYKNGMIYSQLNKNLVLDVNEGDGKRIITFPPHGRANQLWYFDGDETIRNGTGYVLDVKDNRHDHGAELVAWDKHGRGNQRFRRVHV